MTTERTVSRTEEHKWGNAHVQVREHDRRYRTGRVVIPTYSARCPQGPRRKRLKKQYESIYVMDCGNGKESLEVDVNSGNYVRGVVIHVDAYAPKSIEPISSEAFDACIAETVYGMSRTQFAVREISSNPLVWQMFFTDAAMTEGIAMGLLGSEYVYVQFSTE